MGLIQSNAWKIDSIFHFHMIHSTDFDKVKILWEGTNKWEIFFKSLWPFQKTLTLEDKEFPFIYISVLNNTVYMEIIGLKLERNH